VLDVVIKRRGITGFNSGSTKIVKTPQNSRTQTVDAKQHCRPEFEQSMSCRVSVIERKLCMHEIVHANIDATNAR
jgi:hypothetical protein